MREAIISMRLETTIHFLPKSSFTVNDSPFSYYYTRLARQRALYARLGKKHAVANLPVAALKMRGLHQVQRTGDVRKMQDNTMAVNSKPEDTLGKRSKRMIRHAGNMRPNAVLAGAAIARTCRRPEFLPRLRGGRIA